MCEILQVDLTSKFFYVRFGVAGAQQFSCCSWKLTFFFFCTIFITLFQPQFTALSLRAQYGQSTVAWGLLNAYEVSNILLLQCKGPGVTQTLECLRRQQPAQKGAEKDMRLDCIEFHEK